ncbi:MAG: hypothetical protein AB1894_16250 [Chloroflexota bacterium]
MAKIFICSIKVGLIFLVVAAFYALGVTPGAIVVHEGSINLLENIPAAHAEVNQTVPVVVTISRVDAFCDPEASGQDFYADVMIGLHGFTSEEDAGDDDNHIRPNWTFRNPEVDAHDSALPVSIKIQDMDNGRQFPIDPDDLVDIHPDGDRVMLHITYDVASGEWAVDEGPDGPAGDGPFGHNGVWRGSSGTDCAEVEFDISSSGLGDTDGDGLLDNWEEFGLDTDGDGNVDVDLPGMGARLDHKDLFVEVDWMNHPAAPGAHSHEPWQAAWVPVYHAFNDAPVPSPDGTTGIKLHVDTGTLYSAGAWGPIDCDRDGIAVPGDMDCDGDGIIDIGNLGILGSGTPGGGQALAEVQFLDFLGDGSINDFYAFKTIHFDPVRQQVFHYAVFGHDLNAAAAINGVSGRGEIFGNDFLVTLGQWGNGGISPASGLSIRGTVIQHAGTFMHELGHNLNLRHGGADSDNYKPNYLSIMNYSHQGGILGLTANDGLDFSPRALPVLTGGILDENNLDECQALNDPRPGASAEWTNNAAPAVHHWIAFGPDGKIDWNWDNAGTADNGVTCGNPPNLARDLNFRDGGAINLDILQGHNDWTGGDLRLDFRHSGNFANGVPLEMVEEITLAEAEEIAIARPDVLELTSPTQFCPTASLANFDIFPPGMLITHQVPGVTFVDNVHVDPIIRGIAQRGGVPTASMPNSLYGNPQPGPSSFGIPLIILFNAPVYRVGMYIGNGGAGTTPATLRAYDSGGNLIGSVSDPAGQAVTEFLGIYALEGGIRQVQLDYSLSSLAEEIDNLIFDTCESIPTPPIVATEPFSYTVRSEYFVRTPGGGGEQEVVITPIEDVLVQIDTEFELTTFSSTIERNGSMLLVAPLWALGPGNQMLAFSHWRMDEFLLFPQGQTEISVEVDHNTTYTAVYQMAYRYYLPLASK